MSVSEGPISLSPKEQEVFQLLQPVGLHRTSEDLTIQVFGLTNQPINARTIMIGRLRSLGKKLPYTDLGVRLKSTERRGPKPMAFWLETPGG